MEITRDLVFGVMALQKSLLDPTLLARAMSEQFQSGAPLPDVLVGRAWLSEAQCADLNRALDKELQNHGHDLQRVMDNLSFSQVAEDAREAIPGRGPTIEQTLDSDVGAPLCEPGSDEGMRPSAFAETMDSALRTPAIEQTLDSQGGRENGAASDGRPRGTTEDGLQHTLSLRPTGAGVDLEGASSMEPIQNTVEFTPEQCSRYTLTRIYGEGGLGQVWLAIDPSLKREVALKNIRPGKDDALSRQRLIREAQITGQLEHPNIIPIYELEQSSPEATPYYTMRFLRGKTLQEKIVRYQKHRKQGKVDPLELPELLSAFIDICHAIAYAGSRGVMHRDLKPQNIMLGDFGEVLVLDWGLAKKIDDQEVTAGEHGGPLQLAPVADESQTVAGQVMGSPAYMAPEQATGRIDLMDPRTDIYGLGAILFSILTGKGPHRGERTGNTAKDTRALLNRISKGETPRLRDFDPTIPKPLEAICLKAMAKNREERYQTGTELARDIQRYLADEPVSVYAEPWQQRAWRWIRRHRAWTQSVAAALVLTLVVTIVAFILVDQARRNEALARHDAASALVAEQAALVATKAAQEEATRRFRQARRAVDKSFTGISQALEDYPGTHELRAQLLRHAAQEYEQFAAEHSDNPELRLEFILALVRLGEVRRLLGDFAESEEAYQDAIRMFGVVIRETDDNDQLQLALAQCYNSLGLLHVTAGSLAEDAATATSNSFAAASRAYDAASGILAEQSDQAKQTPEFRRTQAQTLANRGELLHWTSEFQAAIDALRNAADAFEQLAKNFQEPDDLSSLAKTRISIGTLLVNTGRSLEAVEELRPAVDCFDELLRQDPNNVKFSQGLADVCMTLGNAQMGMGRNTERLELYRVSLKEYLALVTVRPDVPRYRQRFISARLNLAKVLNKLGRNREAEKHAKNAFDLAARLVEEHPSVADNHLLEAHGLATCGQVFRDEKKNSLAEDAFSKAAEKAAELIGALPDQREYVRLRGEILNNLGTVQLLNQDYTAARSTFLEARAALEKILKESPQDALARDALAWSLAYLGDALRFLDRHDEAAGFYEEALQRHRDNRAEPHREYQLGRFLVDCLDEAKRDPAEAAVIADRISLQYPTNVEYLVLKAAALFRQGAWQACLEQLDAAAKVQVQGKSAIDFWRAMALHQQSAEDPRARLALETACATMDKWAPGDLQLLRLREEATALLEPPSSSSKAEAGESGQDHHESPEAAPDSATSGGE